MIAFLAALVLASEAPAPESGDFAARMRESAGAAQALQGPLDGSWTLDDGHGRPLYILQITDPAGGGGSIEGAWRGAGDAAGVGSFQAIARRGDSLRVRFAGAAPGQAIVLALRRRDAATWAGWMRQGAHATRVAVRRSR